MERVASFLRDLARRIPSDGEEQMLTLPMARADIADHLGLTVETVSRTLTQLRQDDCISVHHNSIGIHHAEALAELTGDAEMMTRAMHHRNLTRH